MRAILVAVILLAACGGGSVPAKCEDDVTTFMAAVHATQTCSADSDCTVVVDYCFGACATLVNVKNATVAQPAEDDARANCTGSTCPSQVCPGALPRYGCVNGVCATKTQ